MNAQHERILGIIADLAVDGQEVDEFSVAQACGAIPEDLPRHAWVNHPCRAELLHAFTTLDQARMIYVTKRGYWGLHMTKRGRQLLAERPIPMRQPLPATPLAGDAPTPPPAEYQHWVSPRPLSPDFAPRQDHFYSTLALAVAALGALLIFAFGQSSYSPLAGNSAAAPDNGAALAVPTIVLPPTPVPTRGPTATVSPAPRSFTVANTGGDGVYLRRAPQSGDRLTAWPDKTTLQEIGPEQATAGTTWRHVRAPDGSEGYVPAQYTALAP